MNVNLSNDEVKIIVTALVKMPWIEVDDIITKLAGPRPEPQQTVQAIPAPTTAPFGVKKDGTPAKRRGRPAKRATQ